MEQFDGVKEIFPDEKMDFLSSKSIDEFKVSKFLVNNSSLFVKGIPALGEERVIVEPFFRLKIIFMR